MFVLQPYSIEQGKSGQQLLLHTEEEGDLLQVLLRALVLKLDRDSELMKELHSKYHLREAEKKKGVQDVTERYFGEIEY